MLLNEVLDKFGTLSWSVHGHTVATVVQDYHLGTLHKLV